MIFEEWIKAYVAEAGWSSPSVFGDGIVAHMRKAWKAATKQALANQVRILTCVYCGHQYEQGTPPDSAQVLTEHIAKCPEHPMAKLRAELEETTRRLHVALSMGGD